jgi:hypothetical protein
MPELVVSCPNCKAKYNVAKLESGSKFKCKSCGKFLIVPQKPELDLEGESEPEEEAVASTKAKGKAKAGGGKPSSKRAAAPAKGRRRESDDDEEGDERVRPTIKRGPNWVMLGFTGAVVLILLIVGVVALVKLSNKHNADLAKADKEREDAEKKKAKNKVEAIPEGGYQTPAPKDKYKKPDKDTAAPGEQVGKDGKIKELEDDKETKGEETERSTWKNEDAKAKTWRFKVRKAVIIVDSSASSKAKGILEKIKKNYEDPTATDEAITELEGMGKDGVVAALNYMTTDINHMSEEGGQLGTVIFGYVIRKSQELWSIENEFNYGAFESGEEKWNAITEMKLKILEKDKAYKIKE